MSGANLEWFEQLRTATLHHITVAGGIKAKREIDALRGIGIDAAVALYKNRVQSIVEDTSPNLRHRSTRW